VIEIAGALESHSNHPIAEAIRRAAGDAATRVEVAGFEERPGVGVRGIIGGTEWELCSPTSAGQRVELSSEVREAVAESESQGHTTLLLLESDTVAGLVGVADEVRPEARTVAAELRRGGIDHLVMLTGDNDTVAGSVAMDIGLTGFRSRLLPAAKVDAVNDLKSTHGTVAMVGDGVNDAPALAAADIGIAMGAAGTDTALETADVALMRDDLRALPGFFALGRRTVSTIRVNVAFSIIVKAVFLVLALSGTATLWMAVFADTGVSLLVILNGMRLMRHRAT
jgi:Cd2+/Zn2+-exporting ATPase